MYNNFPDDRVERETREYFHYYDRMCELQDLVDTRKREYLREIYPELVEEKDESVIKEEYADGEIVFYTLEEYIENEIDWLDSEDFYY